VNENLKLELLTGAYTVRKTYYVYEIQSLENEIGFFSKFTVLSWTTKFNH
jgi:hypothetical protein